MFLTDSTEDGSSTELQVKSLLLVSDVSMLEFNYPHHLFKIQLESRFLQKCPKLSKGNITTILHTNTYSALPLITDAKITPSLSAAQENGFHFQRYSSYGYCLHFHL